MLGIFGIMFAFVSTVLLVAGELQPSLVFGIGSVTCFILKLNDAKGELDE